MKFIIGDDVVVIAGQDKGKTGSIRKISKDDSKVFIDGVNEKTRHIKARGEQPGDRVKFFAPVAISNVAIVDPKTKKPTRIGYKVEGGNKVRVAKASGTVLPTSAKKSKAAPKVAAKTKEPIKA